MRGKGREDSRSGPRVKEGAELETKSGRSGSEFWLLLCDSGEVFSGLHFLSHKVEK